MRSNRWQKGVALLTLVVMSSALVLRANPQNSAEQRIKRVENGLLPPVVLKGETPVRMNIQDRMKFYKTTEYGWPDYRPKEKVITKVDSSLYDDMSANINSHRAQSLRLVKKATG